jgi:hypothetical protein
LQGEGYLFNLSIVAMTFAAVSVLVMLVRQTMGGRLSNFDVYLITSYLSIGFVVAVDAVLPPLVFYYGASEGLTWSLSSFLAAIFLAGVVATFHRRRRQVAGGPMPILVLVNYATHWIAVVLLCANAISLQRMNVFGSALVLSLAGMMWAFVRRIATLLGEKPGDDWDPNRG